MATAKKIQGDISSLKIAIRVAKNDAIKSKLKKRLEMAENELASIKSGAKPRKVSTSKGTKSLLEKAKSLVKKNPKYSGYKGANVDLKKDAEEGALAVGRRVSKGIKGNQYASKKEAKGNVYYEYRVNRLDVKQPKAKQSYPKLEDGGYMASGGEVKIIETKFRSHQSHNPYTDILEGKIDKDSFITYYINVKGKDVGKEGMEYYSGENYVVGSNKKSVSRNYSIDQIPSKYKKAWDKLKLEYNEMHKSNGGYMAKGGVYSSDNAYMVEVFVDDKLVEQKIVRARNQREANEMAEDMDSLFTKKHGDHRVKVSLAPSKNAKGGYMAKGGRIDEDEILDAAHKLSDERKVFKGQELAFTYGARWMEKRLSNKMADGGIAEGYHQMPDGSIMANSAHMAKGGETHRVDDPNEDVEEKSEMEVVRGYSDDEPYEYANGGITLNPGEIVEATTGVKLKVLDFKPDFGGRALVQRIDEFGEGLKPAWMPLTKFKLPKLV